jgi:hypothetical protein
VKAVKKIKGQGNQDGNKDEQKFCVHLIALLRRVGFGFKLGAFGTLAPRTLAGSSIFVPHASRPSKLSRCDV